MRLRELRKLKGITQKELAEKLKLSVAIISKYERNECDPSIENLIKMANIFGVSVDSLVGNNAELIDLTAIDKNRKYAIKKIVYELGDIEVAKLVGYIDK